MSYDDLNEQARRDQDEARRAESMRHTNILVSGYVEYYQALIAQGLPPSLAADLTRDYQALSWARIYWPNNPPALRGQ